MHFNQLDSHFGSEICHLFLGVCEIGDRGVVNVDRLAKKRINEKRSDYLGCFDADSTAFDRCQQKSRFLCVSFEELDNNCLRGLRFHYGHEAADARCRFETNAVEILHFWERVDIFGECLFSFRCIFVFLAELFELVDERFCHWGRSIVQESRETSPITKNEIK
jgi:hypothetical protein